MQISACESDKKVVKVALHAVDISWYLCSKLDLGSVLTREPVDCNFQAHC